MGAYWQFVCVKDACVVLRVNPQRGLGGMKWGEYIGTPCGLRMLEFLQENFCPSGAVWGVACDHGAHNFPPGTAVPDKVYDIADKLEDIACHPLFRKMAKKAQLAAPDPELLAMWDRNTALFVELYTERGDLLNLRRLTSPNLYHVIPQFRRRRLWAILFAAVVFVRAHQCVKQSATGLRGVDRTTTSACSRKRWLPWG